MVVWIRGVSVDASFKWTPLFRTAEMGKNSMKRSAPIHILDPYPPALMILYRAVYRFVHRCFRRWWLTKSEPTVLSHTDRRMALFRSRFQHTERLLLSNKAGKEISQEAL